MASSTAVERPRYLVIDWLRGLAIVCMIAYRTVWDFVTLWETDFSDPWHRALFEPTVAWIPQYIGFTFIFIAGMSFTLGSRHLVKGLQLIAWSTVISLITWFAIPENPVRFGVLNLLRHDCFVGTRPRSARTCKHARFRCFSGALRVLL